MDRIINKVLIKKDRISPFYNTLLFQNTIYKIQKLIFLRADIIYIITECAKYIKFHVQNK